MCCGPHALDQIAEEPREAVQRVDRIAVAIVSDRNRVIGAKMKTEASIR